VDAKVVTSSGSRNQFLITYSSLAEGPPIRTLNKAGWALFVPSVILLLIHVQKTLKERKKAKENKKQFKSLVISGEENQDGEEG
jgi:hypothetical protein